jgi:hypothetical protein
VGDLYDFDHRFEARSANAHTVQFLVVGQVVSSTRVLTRCRQVDLRVRQGSPQAGAVKLACTSSSTQYS